MAVASILHIVHAKAVENVSAVVDNLEAVLERGRLSLDIATANQEELVAWSLNVSKIVLEAHLDVDLASEDELLLNVVLVDELRVTLQHVNRLQMATIGMLRNSLSFLCSSTEDCGCFSSNRLAQRLSQCVVLCNGSECLNRVVGIAVHSALTALLVRHPFIVEPMALALITVDAEYMLQHVSHQTVGLLHLYLLVALCAGQVFRHFILLGHATLLTRKAS